MWLYLWLITLALEPKAAFPFQKVLRLKYVGLHSLTSAFFDSFHTPLSLCGSLCLLNNSACLVSPLNSTSSGGLPRISGLGSITCSNSTVYFLFHVAHRTLIMCVPRGKLSCKLREDGESLSWTLLSLSLVSDTHISIFSIFELVNKFEFLFL